MRSVRAALLLGVLALAGCRAPAGAAVVTGEDPVARAYAAYLGGDLEAARAAFAEVSPGPVYPLTTVRPGLPASVALTPAHVVARAPAGLLALRREDARATAWRSFSDELRWLGALGARERVVVALDRVGAAGADRYSLAVLDAATLSTRARVATGPLSETALPALAPDGAWIAVLDPQRRLRLLDADLRDVATWRPELPPADAVDLAAAPGGRALHVAGRQEAAHGAPVLWQALLRVPDGEALLLVESAGEGAGARAFSADGRWLALADAGELLLVEVESGEVAARTAACADATALAFAGPDELVAAGPSACRLRVPDLALRAPGPPPEPPDAASGLPLELAARIAARWCFDGRAIVPAELRPCR